MTLSQFVKIAHSLIDQSKQKNPNCPCSWRVTAKQDNRQAGNNHLINTCSAA